MADRPLGAQISHMLKARGVETIFGIPGVHNQEMYRGIEEAGITHVLARHEQGAGFMADGYARATGRPGVCYVITGPGLCNIMTPMGQAYSDSVPMLVISSSLDEVASRQGQLHQMKDQRAAGETVSDWALEAHSSQAAYQLIDQAFTEFGTARSRPKSLHVPIAQLEANAPPATAHWFGGDALPRASDAVYADAARAIADARRPLFVLGGGAVAGFEGARQVLAQTQAASLCSYAGRGCADPDDDLHFGSILAREDSAAIAASADLVIAVGTELAEVDLWRAHLGHSCPMIRVDIDPRVLAQPHASEVIQILSGSEAFFQGILDANIAPGPKAWTKDEVAAARATARAQVDAEYPGVMRVADALRACLPHSTMIYSDMTQFAYAAKEVWGMDQPGHWHHPYGFGTLGYALPAAIGGAVGLPRRPVMAIAGDYGFQYTLNELGTAVELGLSLPILLWDNGKLGAIEASMTSAQIAPNAVIARNPDFGLLAQAYGAAYCAPQSLGEMAQVVQQAFETPGPTLIRVTPAIGD